jgi:hypothetical protein
MMIRGFRMKNRLLVLGMLVMVLAFGMTVVGCDDGSKGGGNDGSLNGTWDNPSVLQSIVISGSDFTLKAYGENSIKGTISYNGSTMTLKSTHYWDLDSSSWVAVNSQGTTYTYSLSGNTITISGGSVSGFDGEWTKSQGGGNTAITFSNVSANGSSSQTTTQLTLTFSQAITGLSASDITLSGVSGVSKGILIGSGPTYTLGISGFTSGGTLRVAVAKTGYNISGSPQTATIYYYSGSSGGNTAVTFSNVSANGSSSQTTTQLTLTFSQAITGLSASDITLSSLSGVSKGTLSGSGPTYTLGISGFTSGGTLSVAVAKTGYNISGSPQTATIYYSSGSNDVSLNGTWNKSPISFIVSENEYTFKNNNTNSTNGTISYDGSTITLNQTHMWLNSSWTSSTATYTFTYSLSGNTLTVSGSGISSYDGEWTKSQ